MDDRIAQRLRHYVFSSGDEELRRLLGFSGLMAGEARDALRRSGIGPGWNVIECGCGPLGALPVLAELTGPGGRVTGVDASEEATARARSVAGTLGLDTVRVVEGNVNELDAADPALGAPFDMAYTRLFLVHQTDPVATLRRIASLLRPGGWIIAQEPLLVPPPVSFPRLDALDTYWAMLMTAIAQRAGLPAQSVERLPQAAVAAGLGVVRTDGSFAVGPPSEVIGLHAATLAGARDRIVATGLATAAEIDAVLAAMAAAGESGYEWATSPFFLDLTLRVSE
jgi:ubiquinone/menaquinone biosynthesis C-methylase UbiE